MRECGFKSISELSENLANAITAISKAFAKVHLGIERWLKDKDNVIIEDKSLNCSHKWKPAGSYLIDVCEYCGIKQAKATLSPNVGSMLTPSVVPVLRETISTPKGTMYKDDFKLEINKQLQLPKMFKSASN